MPGMIKAESASPSPDVSHSLLSLRSSSSPPQPSAIQVSQSSAGANSCQSEERGIRLIQLLYLCANAVASNNIQHANFFLEQLSALASITGDPMQRVATYFMEGLAARVTKSWPGLYKALYLTRLTSESELAAARQILFNVCPYLKFGFLTVNQTILDAMQGEKVVHIVDLEVCGENSLLQWLALLQAFSSRSEGPPHLRITAVNQNREVISQMGQRLSETAERLDIPFQFHSIGVSPGELQRDMLGVKSGEAVAVTSIMQLHRLLADDDNSAPESAAAAAGATGKIFNGAKLRDGGGKLFCKGEVEIRKRSRADHPAAEGVPNGVKKFSQDSGLGLGLGVFPIARDENGNASSSSSSSTIERVLKLLHSLSPKIVVVVEQESSHNAPLHERFAPALHYYSALFDSLDSTLPQQSSDRITIERLVFGQEIGNIVACEGLDRVERHEKLESWRRRLEKASFSSAQLSATTAVQAERLLTIHSADGYKLQREKAAVSCCCANMYIAEYNDGFFTSHRSEKVVY